VKKGSTARAKIVSCMPQPVSVSAITLSDGSAITELEVLPASASRLL
jgi:hypothetical protein